MGTKWNYENGDVDPYFQNMPDDKLERWKVVYETLIRDNGPGSKKKDKTPGMLSAWQMGLDMVNKVISERQALEDTKIKQLTIF